MTRGVAQLGRAPALGAGGRRFKSCRPDARPSRHLRPRRRARSITGERTGMVNSTVEKLSPTRVEAHHHGHARGAEAEHRPRVRAHRAGGADPRLPQGQGSAAPIIDQRVGKRRRARARRQRGPRHVLPPGRRGERAARPRPPERRRRRVAEREGLLGRPARRASRSTCAPSSSCPTYEGIDASRSTPSRSTTPTIDEELDRLRSRFGTLVTVDRPATTGDFVELDLVATIDGAEIDTRRGRLVRGRLGRAARGHRRGDRLAHRR